MADGLKLFEEELKSLPTEFQETAQWIAELRAWLQIQTGNARDQWVAASKALERAKEAACEEYDKVSDEIGEKTAWSGITARLTRGKQECTQRYKTEMASLPANLLVAAVGELERSLEEKANQLKDERATDAMERVKNRAEGRFPQPNVKAETIKEFERLVPPELKRSTVVELGEWLDKRINEYRSWKETVGDTYNATIKEAGHAYEDIITSIHNGLEPNIEETLANIRGLAMDQFINGLKYADIEEELDNVRDLAIAQFKTGLEDAVQWENSDLEQLLN